MRAALCLRPTTADDMMLYFQWVNDPAVRAGAFQSEMIDIATHHIWFARAIADKNVRMWVLLANGAPVGQVRLTFESVGEKGTFEKSVALIDYSVAAEQRGHGYGREMLALMECEVPQGMILVGQVKEENVSSRRTFIALGYAETRMADCAFWEYRKHVT